MIGNSLRKLGIGLVASAGAGLLGLIPIAQTPFAYADDTAYVIGGSGEPVGRRRNHRKKLWFS